MSDVNGEQGEWGLGTWGADYLLAISELVVCLSWPALRRYWVPAVLCIAGLSQATNHLPGGAGADCVPCGEWASHSFPACTHTRPGSVQLTIPDFLFHLKTRGSLRTSFRLVWAQPQALKGDGFVSHRPMSESPCIPLYPACTHPPHLKIIKGEYYTIASSLILYFNVSACLIWEQTNLGETAGKHRLKDILFQGVETYYFRHRIQETGRYRNQNGHIHWVWACLFWQACLMPPQLLNILIVSE